MSENTTGFKTSGYIDKKGTPSGDGAKFNQMPPGDDITKQKDADIRDLPMKQVVPLSYPDDGY